MNTAEIKRHDNITINNATCNTDLSKKRPISSHRDYTIANIPSSNQNLIKRTNTGDNISSFNNNIEDYVIGKEIGKGAYAIVKQAVHKPSNLKVAIKIYDKFRLTDSVRKNALKREIQVMKDLNHSNIVKLFEVIDCPKHVKKTLTLFRFSL